jgi:hypothetical protein
MKVLQYYFSKKNRELNEALKAAKSNLNLFWSTWHFFIEANDTVDIHHSYQFGHKDDVVACS